MSLRGKKLGLLLSTRPENLSFRHGVNLAAAALDAGLNVYLHCIDDAKKIWPEGWKSPRPYIRIVPQP